MATYTPQQLGISAPSGAKLIPLTKGKFAIVDNKDFKWLSQWKWWLHSTKWGEYAVRQKMVNRKVYNFSMHREILEHSGINLAGLLVDHKNGNSLDNRKENLRSATDSQNQMNRLLISNQNKSGYKGVTLYRNGKWRSSTKLNQQNIHLGYFDSKEEAAKAYNKFAVDNFGEFAFLNQIGGGL